MDDDMSHAHGFAVFLNDPEGVNVPSVAEALSEELGVHLTEASRVVVAAHGLLARDVEEARARALHERLLAVGAASTLVPEGRLLAVPAPLGISTLNFGEAEHLVLVDERHERTDVPWDRIAVMAVGRIEPPAVRRQDPAKLLPAIGRLVMRGAIRKWRDEYQTQAGGHPPAEDTFLSLLAWGQGREVIHFRVACDKFSYACLGEDIAVQTSANFHALVAALRRRLPGATTDIDDDMMERPHLFPWPVYDHQTEMARTLFRLINIAPRPEGEW